MEIVLKLKQKSRGNVVRFDVVPDENSHDLKVSGMPHYGSFETVVKDEDFKELEDGTEYHVTFERMANIDEPEKQA